MESANVLEVMLSQGSSDSMALVLAAQAQAEIQAAVVMAARKPRDWDVTRERLLRECKRPTFAEVARYKKPIGAGVEGMSIRFAEAAIRLATNIRISQMTVFEDAERRKLRVSVWDLESQVSYAQEVTIEKTVERRSVNKEQTVLRTRKNSKGDLLYVIPATEDDLLNKQNAQISKAIRTQGLRLIPGDIQDECEQEILKTLKDRDAKDPDAAKRKIFDAFTEQGIPVAELKKYLGHDAQRLTPKELSDLRALYSAIRDGETSWRAVVEQMEAERNKETKPEANSTPREPRVSPPPTPGSQNLRDAIANAKAKDQDDEFYRPITPQVPGEASTPTTEASAVPTADTVSGQVSEPSQESQPAAAPAQHGIPLTFDEESTKEAVANLSAAAMTKQAERGSRKK
jgi:hypothetical protein